MSSARISISSFLIASALTVSGCSQMGMEPPTQGLSTTGVAAAAGAALGGGLGAIIGSTTGNAGGGLVIGTIAGATTGGLVGHELEKQEDEISLQREKVQRQEQLLAANKRRLEEVKRSGDVPVTRSNGFNGSSRAKPYRPNEEPVSQAVTETPRARMKPAVREVESKQAPLSGETDLIPPTTKAVPAEGSKLGVPAKTGGLPAPKESADSVDAVDADEAVSPLSAVEEPAPVAAKPSTQKQTVEKSDNKKVSASEELDTEPVAKKSDCAKAEIEAGRARAATSDADRLFYLRRALRLCPSSARYKAELGKVYASIGRVEDAERELSQSLDLDPTNEEARKQLTNLRRGLAE